MVLMVNKKRSAPDTLAANVLTTISIEIPLSMDSKYENLKIAVINPFSTTK